MTQLEVLKFGQFSEPLIGLKLSRIWQGYGSAIFLEFGKVQPRIRRDGSPGNPRGEMTLSITWSWRVEGKRRIWCGSWSDGERWPRVFKRLEGQSVTSIQLIGRLGEIDVAFSNGLHMLSFMTAEGDPEWCLTDRRVGRHNNSLEISAGRLRASEGRAD